MIPKEILRKIRQIEMGAGLLRIGILCCLMILACSCTSPRPVEHLLPAATSFNVGAGCGFYLLVKLHMGDDEDLLFLVDTGAPVTVFNKSLEAKLGKPMGHQKINFPLVQNIKDTARRYESPALYLGKTPLRLGEFVVVSDRVDWEQQGRIAGILGMDCMQHYCIQLDFDSRTVRFLDSESLETESLGQAYPLKFSYDFYPFVLRSSASEFRFPWGSARGNLCSRLDLFGSEKWMTVDTGTFGDVILTEPSLKRALMFQDSMPTVQFATNGTDVWRSYRLPAYAFAGAAFTNVHVTTRKDGEAHDYIGLGLLARNLVTLNFPKQTMYLKQQRVGPLQAMSDEERSSSRAFIYGLKAQGRLPGLPTDARGVFSLDPTADGPTIVFQSQGDLFASVPRWHYRVDRANDSSWKLLRAWRTDKEHKVVEEFPTP